MEFKNKVVLITGAGSGIGRVAAQQFASEGAQVVVSDISEKGGEQTVHLIKAVGGTASFIKTDVANVEDVKMLLNKIVNNFGRVDIAINNAGIGGIPLKTEDHGEDNFNKVMAVNANGVFYCMKYEIQQMLKQGGGVIVNTASIAGLRGLPNNISYVASKHAVVGMTKTAAMEYAKKNIRINAICPSFTVTPLFQPQFFDNISPGLSEKLRKSIPIKRFGKPEEIANAMLWLCSDKASFVTGHALPVDGGQTA